MKRPSSAFVRRFSFLDALFALIAISISLFVSLELYWYYTNLADEEGYVFHNYCYDEAVVAEIDSLRHQTTDHLSDPDFWYQHFGPFLHERFRGDDGDQMRCIGRNPSSFSRPSLSSLRFSDSSSSLSSFDGSSAIHLILYPPKQTLDLDPLSSSDARSLKSVFRHFGRFTDLAYSSTSPSLSSQSGSPPWLVFLPSDIMLHVPNFLAWFRRISSTSSDSTVYLSSGTSPDDTLLVAPSSVISSLSNSRGLSSSKVEWAQDLISRFHEGDVEVVSVEGLTSRSAVSLALSSKGPLLSFGVESFEEMVRLALLWDRTVEVDVEMTIPRLIHQVQVDSNECRKRYEMCGWEHRLWHRNSFQIFSTSTSSSITNSLLIGLIATYQNGGFYIPPNLECLKTLEKWRWISRLSNCDVVSVCHIDNNGHFSSDGLIGGPRFSPSILRLIEEVAQLGSFGRSVLRSADVENVCLMEQSQVLPVSSLGEEGDHVVKSRIQEYEIAARFGSYFVEE